MLRIYFKNCIKKAGKPIFCKNEWSRTDVKNKNSSILKYSVKIPTLFSVYRYLYIQCIHTIVYNFYINSDHLTSVEDYISLGDIKIQEKSEIKKKGRP